MATITEFTVADAKRHAEAFCHRNPTWRMICDLDEADYSPLPWSMLPREERRHWLRRYGSSAPEAWAEFGTNKPMPYRMGYVSGAGEFFNDVLDVPRFHNLMTVVEVGGERGAYRRNRKQEAAT